MRLILDRYASLSTDDVVCATLLFLIIAVSVFGLAFALLKASGGQPADWQPQSYWHRKTVVKDFVKRAHVYGYVIMSRRIARQTGLYCVQCRRLRNTPRRRITFEVHATEVLKTVTAEGRDHYICLRHCSVGTVTGYRIA